MANTLMDHLFTSLGYCRRQEARVLAGLSGATMKDSLHKLNMLAVQNMKSASPYPSSSSRSVILPAMEGGE